MTYQGFGKIPRLSREVIITEKLDGTNGQIAIMRTMSDEIRDRVDEVHRIATLANFHICAGSRNRWLGLGKSEDNHGFASWVKTNAEELLGLGEGRHFGEWWGGNIARKYGVAKRFSLFNTERWNADTPPPACCGVVPVINRGILSDALVEEALDALRKGGSQAAPGFMDPEGVVVFHTAAKQLFEKLLVGDELPKGRVDG